MSAPRRVAVLASGAGSNLRAVLDACDAPGHPATVVLVLSNRRRCGALAIARARGVAATSMPVADFGGDATLRDRAMLDALGAAAIELVVCAGYDRVLSDEFLAAFPNAILNIHPSLLPAFGGGMHAVEDALAAGVKVTGCTVHLLAAGAVDRGPIVLQAAVAVEQDDDVHSLHARIHEQEWRLLPEAIALWATGRLRTDGSRVRILPPPRIPEGVG
ncbi:MAG: phosphoribosylglycinamide formyltransferase [Candidatus Dormibacteria bacterium]